MDSLFGMVRPVSYVLPIPIILPGEKAMTTAEPFRSLVEEARRLEHADVAEYGAPILAATLFVGCAWTDSVDTGMSVMVTADGSRDAARAAAVDLAARIWEVRDQFSFGCDVAELADGVDRAAATNDYPVFLTDSGDNVTGSAPGDLPVVLHHLIEHEIRDAVVAGITDPQAVDRCFSAGEGATLSLAIGATVETRFDPPLAAEARMLRLVADPRMAIVQIGGVEAVKQGYLFPELTAIAARHIMLLTPGAGDMRTESLPYLRRQVPAFPFETETEFSPGH